jgi:hypothetical protein
MPTRAGKIGATGLEPTVDPCAKSVLDLIQILIFDDLSAELKWIKNTNMTGKIAP